MKSHFDLMIETLKIQGYTEFSYNVNKSIPRKMFAIDNEKFAQFCFRENQRYVVCKTICLGPGDGYGFSCNFYYDENGSLISHGCSE